MKYPKINSLFKRDETTNRLMLGSYSLPEFGLINKWLVQEKIDGMNIRIIINPDDLSTDISTFQIKGRTDDAMVPPKLVKHIVDHFPPGKLQELIAFMNAKSTIILFGEGYGPKIQSGGNYRDDIGFILFDVWGGNRWSTREEVQSIADLLTLPTPPVYGLMTKEEIIELVRAKPNSTTAIRPMQTEGVICRSEPLLINNYTRDAVMFKLKCKDF